MIVPTNALLQQLLIDAVATVTAGNFTGILNEVKVFLIQGAFNPGPNLTLAEITEANYTGYARRTMPSWNPAYVSQDGNVAMDSVSEFFAPTGPVTVMNVVTGLGLVDFTSGLILLAAERFATPVPMQTVNSGLLVTLKLELPWGQGMGESVLIF